MPQAPSKRTAKVLPVPVKAAAIAAELVPIIPFYDEI